MQHESEERQGTHRCLQHSKGRQLGVAMNIQQGILYSQCQEKAASQIIPSKRGLGLRWLAKLGSDHVLAPEHSRDQQQLCWAKTEPSRTEMFSLW